MNNSKKIAGVALACLLGLCACGGPNDGAGAPSTTAATPASPAATMPSGGQQSADVTGLNEAGQSWLSAFTSGNGAGLGRFYADDAMIMPEAAPSAEGSAAIGRFLSAYFSKLNAAGYTVVIQPNRISNEVSGNLGYRSGTYVMTDSTGSQVDSGKWLQVWRRTGGEWRILRDTWNSDGLPVMLGDDSEEDAGNTG